jgi:hypothetical protein
LAARRLIASAAAALSMAVLAPSAGAAILSPVTLDGPSQDIVGFGGAAMAEDGSGGVVYLKAVGGTPHVFVSRYIEGRWLAPVRVDYEEPYAAGYPQIGAVDGGELVVVWVTAWATEGGQPVDELLSATLDSGSSGFGPAQIVDPDIGRGTGASPDLAVTSTGQGDVVYRVVSAGEGQKSTLLRPGDVGEEVRVAHFNGETWTDLGAINKDPSASMRPPTEANEPRIALGPTGNGVVVWQEPEAGRSNITGTARIWARRIFGSSLGYVMEVSAEAYDGVALEQDAEAPAVAVSYLGQAQVAYRQPAGANSPLPGPRIFVNDLPNGESGVPSTEHPSGTRFAGAVIADPSVTGGKAAVVGPPTLDLDGSEELRLLYDSNGAPRVVEGTDKGLAGTLSLGPAWVGSEYAGASVVNPEGGGISAWPTADAHGSPAVAVREDFPGGGVQTGLVSGGAGGRVGEISVGRSTLGDGLVAWLQGRIGDAAIVADDVSAPPGRFAVSVPRGWVKPAGVVVTWQPPVNANGPLAYRVVLDGREVLTSVTLAPSGVYEARLPTAALGSGRHSIQVLATDRLGGSTLTGVSKLRVDGVAPTVRVLPTRRGNAVTVRASDRYAGLDAAAVAVSFGDGSGARGRAYVTHRYAHPGVYTVVVDVRDRIGNSAVVRQLVSVR